MKVLYVGSDALATGASFSMLKLIEEFDKRSDLTVVPVVHEGNTEKVLQKNNRTHYVVNAQSWIYKRKYSGFRKIGIIIAKTVLNIPCYFKYLRIIELEKPDIIHINSLTTYVIAKAAIRRGIPLVWHIREMIEEDFDCELWNKNFANRLFKKTDRFIAISECVKKKYSKVIGEEKVTRIYNGVDTTNYADIEHVILNKSTVIISMAGRINENKGQLQCLRELIPVLQERKNVIVQFAGEGTDDEIDKINRLIHSANINEQRVRLLGFVTDMRELWKNTDIAIVYSKYEAFGRVTIEAKMGGALVVGYNSGGTTELIENGVDGYLFGNGYKSLKETVELILMNPRQASTVAVQGREKAKTVFTSENNAIQIERLYKEILDK